MIESLKQQQEEQTKAAQTAKTVTQNLIRLFTAPLTAFLGIVDSISEGLVKLGVLEEKLNLEESFSGGIAGLLFDPEAVEEEGQQAIDKAEEQLVKLENQRAGYINRRNDEEAREAEQKRDKDNREAEAELKQQEANEKYLAEQIKKIKDDLELAAIQDEEARASRRREMQYEQAQEQLIARGATDEQLLLLEEQFQKDLDAIRDDYAEKRRIKNEQDAEAAKRKKKQDYDDDRKLVMDNIQMQETVVSQGLSVISNLNEAASKKDKEQSKKQFQRNQALAVAETLVSTYFSAQKAYQSQLTATPDSPIRAALAAAAAVASGLARVAAIKAQKFNAGSSGGGGGGGGRSGFSGPQAPAGGPPMPQRLVSPDQMRAYVVQTDLQGSTASAEKTEMQTVL
jgi:hypothetical protein